MIKSYEATIEEAVQANFRLCEMVGHVRKRLWLGLTLGVPAVLLALHVAHVVRLLHDALAATFYVLLYLAMYKSQIRREIRKTLVRSQGTDRPVRCAFEIDEDGLSLRQPGAETRFGWQHIQDVQETPEVIEIILHPAGVVHLPKRIFESPEELASCLAALRRGMRGPAEIH